LGGGGGVTLDALGGAVLTVGMVPLPWYSLSRNADNLDGDFTRLQQCFINKLVGGAGKSLGWTVCVSADGTGEERKLSQVGARDFQ
jgi:hypothetical protein